jgi:beta-galactosidase
VGYNGTKQVNVAELHTAGAPVAMKLTADRTAIKANGQDLSYITVELVDANGYRNHKAENEIRFSIQGDATLAGVGNSNPVSLESYQQPQRKAWQGRCMAILKAGYKGGPITLKASAEGLPDSTITIEAAH